MKLSALLRRGLRTALRDRHSVPVIATPEPRTWTFTDRASGEQLTFTCLPGCVDKHQDVAAGEATAEDVWCFRPADEVSLPINANGEPEDFTVLRAVVNVDPFDQRMANRLPHIDLEVIDGAFIEGLDPDGLGTVIRTLQGRLDELTALQAELTILRADYREQAQR